MWLILWTGCFEWRPSAIHCSMQYATKFRYFFDKTRKQIMNIMESSLIRFIFFLLFTIQSHSNASNFNAFSELDECQLQSDWFNRQVVPAIIYSRIEIRSFCPFNLSLLLDIRTDRNENQTHDCFEEMRKFRTEKLETNKISN